MEMIIQYVHPHSVTITFSDIKRFFLASWALISSNSNTVIQLTDLTHTHENNASNRAKLSAEVVESR
jgi:hypothetical protein